jgi:hypothetical protein
VNFTDPTGYCFLRCFWRPAFRAIGQFFRQSWGAILQIAAVAMCGGNPVCGALVGGATSAFVVGVNGGNFSQMLRAGLTSAFTAAAMFAVGSAFPSGTLPNIAGHAVVGCLAGMMGGGACGPGALSAGITAAAGPLINGKGFSVGSLVANAVIGGLASVAGGGKFANGAITAAYGYLFNQAGNHYPRCGTAYCTPEDAARAALDIYNPQSWREEWGGLIYRNADGTFYFTRAISLGSDRYTAPFLMADLVPPDATIVGDYHTHPQEYYDRLSKKWITAPNGNFSTGQGYNDINSREKMFKDGVLKGTVIGDIKIPWNFRSFLGTPYDGYWRYMPVNGKIERIK